MEDQDDDSLEFQEEAQAETLARQAFRVPVQGKARFTLEREGKTYEIFDVSVSGNSVSVNTENEWPVNSLISDCSLNLDLMNLQGLEGRVIRSTPDKRNHWIIGIHWLNIPKDQLDAIENLLYALRQELFETEE